MCDEAPEAQRGVRAVRRSAIERDERAQRRRVGRMANQQELVIGRAVTDHQVRAVFGVATDDVVGQVRQ